LDNRCSKYSYISIEMENILYKMTIMGAIFYGASVGSIFGWIFYTIGNSGHDTKNSKNLFLYVLVLGSVGSMFALGKLLIK